MGDLGGSKVRMSTVDAALGDPAVFAPVSREAFARTAAAIQAAEPRDFFPAPAELPMERDLREINATLRAIYAHLTRPRWYTRLWAFITRLYRSE